MGTRQRRNAFVRNRCMRICGSGCQKPGFCSENEEIRVILRGGELTVTYTEQTVWMTGNAELTFEGSAEI